MKENIKKIAGSDKPKNTSSEPKTAQPQVQWNTKDLKSSYANICTMNSTREEVILNFGINQA